MLLPNLDREDLGLAEHFNRRRVLQNVAVPAEHLQDLVLDLFQLLGVGGALYHEPRLLLLEVRPLLGDDNAEKL